MKKVNSILFLYMPLLLNNVFILADNRFEDTFDNSQQVFNFANNLFSGFKNALPTNIHDQTLLNKSEDNLFNAILFPQQYMLKNGRFKKDAINTIVNAAIVGYTEGISYKIALKATGNTKVAENVSESMEAHTVLYLDTYSTASNKEITQFIANKLSNLLFRQRKVTETPSAPPIQQIKPAKIYEMTECPSCWLYFEAEVTRRLLRCGHSICTDCASRISSKKCPMCREKTV